MLSVLTLPRSTKLNVKSRASGHFRSFLTELRHPFISQVLDVSYGPPTPDLAQGQLFVLRQFVAGGSLKDRIHGKANPRHGCQKKYGKAGKPLKEPKCALLGKQIIDGLIYLTKVGEGLGLELCAGLRASDVLLRSADRAILADFENDLVGLPAQTGDVPGPRAFSGPDAPALRAFAHIFFEMATLPVKLADSSCDIDDSDIDDARGTGQPRDSDLRTT